jgi:hypothetical protein
MSTEKEKKPRKPRVVRSKYFRKGPLKYNDYVHSAKNRKIEMKLSEQDMCRIFMQHCFYCGDPPDPEKLNGADRIDSKGAYEDGNVVPCCKTCNFLKGKLDVHEFLHRVETIATRGALVRDGLCRVTNMTSGSTMSTNLFQASINSDSVQNS